jgi:hypothetical protein
MLRELVNERLWWIQIFIAKQYFGNILYIHLVPILFGSAKGVASLRRLLPYLFFIFWPLRTIAQIEY